MVHVITRQRRGSWAFVVVRDNVIVDEKCDKVDNTSIGKMELLAVLNALMYIDDHSIPYCVIYTDSQYVQRGLTEWLDIWKLRLWRTANGDSVKNQQYWIALDRLYSKLNVDIKWVRGHNGNKFNERADKLCTIVKRNNYEN